MKCFMIFFNINQTTLLFRAMSRPAAKTALAGKPSTPPPVTLDSTALGVIGHGKSVIVENIDRHRAINRTFKLS